MLSLRPPPMMHTSPFEGTIIVRLSQDGNIRSDIEYRAPSVSSLFRSKGGHERICHSSRCIEVDFAARFISTPLCPFPEDRCTSRSTYPPHENVEQVECCEAASRGSVGSKSASPRHEAEPHEQPSFTSARRAAWSVVTFSNTVVD